MSKNNLQDVASERAVLSVLCQHGSECYFDVNDILSEDTFVVDTNIILYKCLKNIFENDQSSKVDIATILSSANGLGLDKFL